MTATTSGMQRDEAIRTVDLLYRLLLGREADPGGREHNVEQLVSGRRTAPDLALDFIGSPEFRQRRADPVAFAGYETIETSDGVFLAPEGSGLAAELTGGAGYEPWVMPYFLERCRPGATVLDIGASVGAFAIPAAKRVGPEGKVFAVEVSPLNCRLLAQSIALNKLDNLRLLPLGAADALGFAQLPRRSGSYNNAVEAEGRTLPGDIQSHDVVPLLPLDLLRPVIGRVDLIKLDIEGMEYRALRGALETLRADLPTVFLEYSPVFQQQGSKVSGAVLLRLFNDLGYRVEILHRSGRREMVAAADASLDVDHAWRMHVARDAGTHLDLCLHPPADGC